MIFGLVAAPLLLAGGVPIETAALSLPPKRSDATIIVTGERTKRSLRDTPSSARVFSGTEVSGLAAPDRVEQLLELTPNVQLGSKGDAPSVRGQDGTGVLTALAGFLGGARPRLTVQVDGRAISYNELAFGVAPLWDVERVEVFRSPQSTTQGRNSIGGAIFVQTAAPSFALSGKARIIVGDACTREVSAMVTGPVIDDQLSIRLSGDFRRSRTSSDLQGPINGVDLNRESYDNLRAKLFAQPRGLPGFKLLATYSHIRSGMPQFEGVRQPFRIRRDPAVFYGYFSTRVDSLTVLANVELSTHLESRITASFGNASIRRFAPRGFGETRVHANDLSFENILEWTPAGDVAVTGGVYLFRENIVQKIDLSAALFGLGQFRDQQDSEALFGEVRWTPAPRLTIVGGLRQQVDRRSRTGALVSAIGAIPLDYRKRFSVLLPKLSISYDINSDIRIGALVQRASNPGGVTLNLRFRRETRFDAERLSDFELFTRATALDGKLTVSGNLFYNDIHDAQRPQQILIATPGGTVTFSDIANAPAAETFGAELEATYQPSDRLTLRAGIGLLNTRITKTLAPNDPLRGRRFARSPEFNATAGVDWHPINGLRVSSQIRHNSSYFSDDAESPGQRIAGSTTIDAKISWHHDRLMLFGYARNLLNEFHLTSWQSPDLATANDPREFGLGIERSF